MPSNVKQVKSISELRTEQVNKVQERGLKKLDELFNALWEEAQGVKLLVTPGLRGNQKPKNADKTGTGYVVESVCPKCKLPICKEDSEIYEVWKVRRDTGLLKYLFDQQVGRSSQKDKDTVDPEIIIIFDDIDSIRSSPSKITSPETVDRADSVDLELASKRLESSSTPPPDLGLPDE